MRIIMHTSIIILFGKCKTSEFSIQTHVAFFQGDIRLTNKQIVRIYMKKLTVDKKRTLSTQAKDDKSNV